MSSQNTIEDPTLYQDMVCLCQCQNFSSAGVTEDIFNSIRSASLILQPAPERQTDSKGKGDKERIRVPPYNTADSSLHSQLERVRLLVTQLGCNFIQLKERVEETRNNISCVMTHLEELDDLLNSLRNVVDKTKGTTKRSWKEGGILKRGKEGRDDGYQLRSSTQRKKKGARVTWEG
ncbi:hypothetical protein GQ44DRAFT_666502 [Phaeosphaeriaceae sp. PMI808]|nr:hypothetical protein GQ44DRAFT_666502 [Phaeosphaeriaceae sp. PMI808]